MDTLDNSNEEIYNSEEVVRARRLLLLITSYREVGIGGRRRWYGVVANLRDKDISEWNFNAENRYEWSTKPWPKWPVRMILNNKIEYKTRTTNYMLFSFM